MQTPFLFNFFHLTLFYIVVLFKLIQLNSIDCQRGNWVFHSFMVFVASLQEGVKMATAKVAIFFGYVTFISNTTLFSPPL